MAPIMWLLRFLALLVAALGGLAAAWAPTLVALTPAPSLERQVNAAIQRGIDKLRAAQRPDGSFGGLERPPPGGYPMGYTALVTYALLKSGVATTDPVVKAALDHLAGLPLLKTYSVSSYALALDAGDDPSAPERLHQIALWLEQNLDERTSLWGYPDGSPELSNTQFAVMALAAAARHGHRTPPKFWTEVIDGALERQNDTGGFYYRSDSMPETSGSMTTAGITTLHVARQALASERRYDGPQRKAAAGIERALAWLDARFSTTGNPIGDQGILRDRYPAYGAHNYHYYFLYGIERVAALLDRREFGGLPWYRQGAHELLAHESEKGG
jgi:hypothetical protein